MFIRPAENHLPHASILAEVDKIWYDLSDIIIQSLQYTIEEKWATIMAMGCLVE